MVVAQSDLVESDASLCGRSQGHLGAAGLGPMVRADGPVLRVLPGPVGGQGGVMGDWLAEVVGDVALEPAVEQAAFGPRVRVGAFRLPVLGDGLAGGHARGGGAGIVFGIEADLVLGGDVCVLQVIIRLRPVPAPADRHVHAPRLMLGRGYLPGAVLVGRDPCGLGLAEQDAGGRDGAGEVDHARPIPAGGGAVAQLAVAVDSPGVEVAVRADRCGMVASWDRVFPGEPGGCALGLADQDWPAPGGVGAVAQLAVFVASPDVEVAVRAQRLGMPVA